MTPPPSGSAATANVGSSRIPVSEGQLETLRRLTLFAGVPEQSLRQALASCGVAVRLLDRDQWVVEPTAVGPESPICFVAVGQVAIGAFAPLELSSRCAEMVLERPDGGADGGQLAPLPLARLAKKNVALLGPGDLFNAAALAGSGDSPLAAYTVAPSAVVSLAPWCAAELARAYPALGERLRAAVDRGTQRLRAVSGARQELLDFYVRHGLCVSGESVRVRQLDRCIDCGMCEDACEERYGAKRLTLNGYQLGRLDFVYTCRTCWDRRCLDHCDYDAIKFDEQLREVVIDDAKCTGCTMCAQLCPYGSIAMVDLHDSEHPTFSARFRERLQNAGALDGGASDRRIATKCDHCNSYGEQACISACPTGALVELSATSLFSERPASGQQGAGTLLPLQPFADGIGVRDGGLSRIHRTLIGVGVPWVLGMLAVLACAVEVLLRSVSPTRSLLYLWNVKIEGMSVGLALQHTDFAPADPLAMYCGYFGTGLLAICVLYPVVRHTKLFRRFSTNKLWLDFHIMAGTVGPLLIAIHSAFKLDNWVSLAFWSMVLATLSGVVGRYLYTRMPDEHGGGLLEDLDHERAIAALRGRVPAAVAVCDRVLAQASARVAAADRGPGLWWVFGWVVVDSVRRFGRWRQLRQELKATGASSLITAELLGRVGRLQRSDRQRLLMSRLRHVLRTWRRLHLAFATVMTATALVHIYWAYRYSM